MINWPLNLRKLSISVSSIKMEIVVTVLFWVIPKRSHKILCNGCHKNAGFSYRQHICQWSLEDGFFTNQSALLADLFLYSNEVEFVQELMKAGNKRLVRQFTFTYRYIDDVLSLNNPKFSEYLDFIYPSELEIKETTESATSASYLDCFLYMDNGKLNTRLYDKRDYFNFPIVNFPFLNTRIFRGQHQHTEFMFHGWSVMLELVLSIKTLLTEGNCWQPDCWRKATLNLNSCQH